MRLRRVTLPLILLIWACESPTELAGVSGAVATSARRYVAEATPLPATLGFLTRYDFDVLVRVWNRTDFPMLLDRCEGKLFAIVAGGGPEFLDEDGARFIVEAELSLCDEVDQIALQPGQSVTHHVRFWGLSSSALFMGSMDKSYQVIVATRGQPLWSAPFTIHLPEE